MNEIKTETLNEFAAYYISRMTGRGSQNKMVQERVKDAIFATAAKLTGIKVIETPLPNFAPEHLLNVVCQYTDITVDQVQSGRRKQEIIKARHYAVYVLNKYTNLSLTSIAHAVGITSHATVLHAVKKIDFHKQKYRDVELDIQELDMRILGLCA